MCVMPDSNRTPPPTESSQSDFPHGLHDVHTSAPKLIDEQRLVGVTPGQAIRGVDIQAPYLPACGRITKSLESRAHKDGAAVAFVHIAIVRFEQKAIGRDALAQ
jgi:hypothetical protein